MATKAEDIPVKKQPEKQEMSAPGGRAYPPLMSLRQQVDRLFDQFLDEGWMRPMTGFSGIWDSPLFKSAGMDMRGLMESPRTDMSESDKEYELSIELPGMSEKDVEVTVHDNMITLKGEKKSERETMEKDYHIAERSYGSVRRTFSMPSDVDSDKVKASFSKGVLTVHLPKTNEARAKPLKVDVKGE
ncbi:MAG TPA: Hsp20/alpha crystallin family protein [Gammaproteobacteria bacterium]|nr:Hsp20/alpha crystallin family protein [Gammaproteobacteria bacterium]